MLYVCDIYVLYCVCSCSFFWVFFVCLFFVKPLSCLVMPIKNLKLNLNCNSGNINSKLIGCSGRHHVSLFVLLR